ncbi:hypothetical protein EWM64_g8200 [Hericium alpestre]|uniref:F-box domain-containing protein n=1 Tax=Hericium alpestre TaxID=135208 RepID=A0A4Y9ZNI0_9AGAM|nr:hypothetical protein EWM64_g8200 [Hericium alpestre]
MSWLVAEQQQAAIHFMPSSQKPALNRDGPTMHGELARMALIQRQNAPIHNLPVELLSRIFLLGYSDGVDPARPFKRKTVEGLNWERARASTVADRPQLESLQLWHLQEWATSQNLFTATAKPPVKILNDDVPSLVNLSLVGVNLAWSQEEYLVALKQIEFALHSEGVRPSVKEWETLLRDSPDLERLSLHYSGPRIDGPWSSSPIELRVLRELSFTDMDPDVLCITMEHLSLPTLRVLELELPEQDFSAFLELVSNAETPYFPLLDTLRVSALDCSTEAWSKFLLAVPKLSFLETDFRRVQHDFFQILFTKVPRSEEPVSGTSESAIEEKRTSPDPPTHSVGGKSVDDPPYNVLLPSLAVLKVAGLPADRLLAFVDFRRMAGYPIPRFMVHNKLTSGEMSALEQAQVAVEYYQYSDDEEEEEEEEEEDEDVSEADEAEEEDDDYEA